MDQTGLNLIPAAHWTYDKKGSTAVAVVGAEDKRQITGCIASSLRGDMLPLQLIFAGTTQRCHPAATAASNAANVHITHSPNHWSSLETMQEWVTQVLLPYAERQIAAFKLRSDSHIVLLLDVWSVHKGEPFRRFLRTYHPQVHLVFVPANCTSKLQVADVALQRPFKTSVRRCFDEWASETLRRQMAAGAAVSLKESFGMPVIKPLLLDWCIRSWKELQERKQLILWGWGQCVTALYDVHDPEKRMQAMREVAQQQLDPVLVPLEEEDDPHDDDEEQSSSDGESAAPADVCSSDEQKDELDLSVPVAQGERRSTRVRQPAAAAAGSYLINSQQIWLTEDSEA
jgi:hypothetical protein